MRAIFSALVLSLLASPAWARVTVSKVVWKSDCDLLITYKSDRVSYSVIRGSLLYGQSTDLRTTDNDRITVRSLDNDTLLLTFVLTGIDGAQFVAAKRHEGNNFVPVNTVAIVVPGPNAEVEFNHELGQMSQLYGNSEARGLLIMAGFFSGSEARGKEWMDFVNLMNDGKLDPRPSEVVTKWETKPKKHRKSKVEHDLAQTSSDEKKADASVKVSGTQLPTQDRSDDSKIDRREKKKKKKHKTYGPHYEEIRGPYFNFFY